MQAIELALAGKWDEAHKVVQKHEDDKTACFIHAILHQQEGDEANAMYWFRRAGVEGRPDGGLEGMLRELRDELGRQP